MRFQMQNDQRKGYVVQTRVSGEPMGESIHVLLFNDAEGVGLQRGDTVELEFPGDGFRDSTTVAAEVVGVVQQPDDEPVQF